PDKKASRPGERMHINHLGIVRVSAAHVQLGTSYSDVIPRRPDGVPGNPITPLSDEPYGIVSQGVV
ncbi:MAG TPA: hypothetical protein VEP70_08525, partial [Burkholderiales bacterium]|nr:hypothetical protein [Burkholderiales bacterium]